MLGLALDYETLCGSASCLATSLLGQVVKNLDCLRIVLAEKRNTSELLG